MNSRERVQKVLRHQQPDRVPIDLGATGVTGIAAGTLDLLRKALKLKDKKVKVHHPFMLLGYVEEDVMEALGVDVAGIWSPYNSFGFKNDNWKPWKLPCGTEVLVGQDFNTTQDQDGNIYLHPKGDVSVPPSAKLPKDGYYFDLLTRQEAVDEDSLDGRRDFREQYAELGEEVLKHIEKSADDMYKNTGYALVGNFSGAGLGDIGQVPGPGMKRTPGIRRPDEWYMAHLLYPGYIKDIFDYQTEIALKNLELYRQAVGNKIEVLAVSGTDFGTQRGEFISPDMFREFYKPHYSKINDWIHRNTAWKTFFHTCGSIVNLIDDMIEMGVDILNPVQCSAAGMDPDFLKKRFGGRIVFWGGGVDTQKTLPFGTPSQVREEVLDRLEVFSKGGGYVFSAIHNIQQLAPVENILAMFDAVKEFNGKM